MLEKERVIKSSGNVFLDLSFEPAEAQVLALHADLKVRLRRLIEERDWTQVEAARELGIAQSRISDLTNGKWGNAADFRSAIPSEIKAIMSLKCPRLRGYIRRMGQAPLHPPS